MALFGAPITHEDHAIRALQAGLTIQTDLAGYADSVQRRWGVPFRMRIGVNTGAVVVGRIGDNLRMDYTAQGDTTNLAARLQQMAPPGAIWVGEATYRAASGAFEWRPIGTVSVKGREAPVPAYELLGRRAVRSRFEVHAQRGLTRFVGRDPEFQHLLGCWEKAKQGQGQVVSVVGEAGMGKSRLLHEFKERLARDGARYLEGSCFTYGDSISYLPFIEIVKAFLGLEGIAAEADVKRQIAQRVEGLDLDPATVLPYLHNLLALAVEDVQFAMLPPDLVRERTVKALTTVVSAAATRQPLALIIEDVHWIDKATEDVLGTLVEVLPGVPLLLVLVYRPEYLHAWSNKTYHAQIALARLPGESSAEMVRAILHKPYASSVPLERLSPDQSTALVQELLGTVTIPPELERLVAHKTDGNPFFIEELTLSLRESGDLRRDNGGYVLQRPIEALRLPTTVEGVLLARIDRLTEGLKEVVQAAAVVGRVFSLPVLARVVERPADLDEALLHLEDLEFIRPTSVAPQREYSFKHVLTQEAVYSTLLRPRRETYHERVGRAIETLYSGRLEERYELLAHHYSRSANADRALEYLDLAGQKANKAGAMVEAKGYFEEAMKLLDGLPATGVRERRRIALLVSQWDSFWLLFQYRDYYELVKRYESVAIGLGDPQLLRGLYTGLGYFEWALGHYHRAIDVLTSAVELCEHAGDDLHAARALVGLQWAHLWRGNYDQTVALKAHAARRFERNMNVRWYAWGLDAAAVAYIHLGRWDKAIEECRVALSLAAEFSDRSAESFTTLVIGWTHMEKRDIPQARRYAELAARTAPTPAEAMWAQAYLAMIACRSGEPHRGIKPLTEYLAIFRSAPHMPSAHLVMMWLGEAYWLAGDHEQARRQLEECLESAQECGNPYPVGTAYRILGEMATQTQTGQAGLVLAETQFTKSMAVFREINAENKLALAYAGYGRLHRQRGQMENARRYLREALEIFERLGTLHEPDKVRRDLAELPAV